MNSDRSIMKNDGTASTRSATAGSGAIMRYRRFNGWDYSRGTSLFITIATEARQAVFGYVAEGGIQLSPLGEIVLSALEAIPQLNPGITLFGRVVMPDHVHFNLCLAAGLHEPLKVLGNAIRRFKNHTTKMAKLNLAIRTGGDAQRLWQQGYHDYLLVSRKMIDCTERYIAYNPMKWQLMHGTDGGMHICEPLVSCRLDPGDYWKGVGNISLLDGTAKILSLRVSREVSSLAAIARVVKRIEEAVDKGYVVISGFISKGEQAVRDMLCRKPTACFIRILPSCIPNRRFKPESLYVAPFAEGRYLEIAEGNDEVAFGRGACLDLNEEIVKIATAGEGLALYWKVDGPHVLAEHSSAIRAGAGEHRSAIKAGEGGHISAFKARGDLKEKAAAATIRHKQPVAFASPRGQSMESAFTSLDGRSAIGQIKRIFITGGTGFFGKSMLEYRKQHPAWEWAKAEWMVLSRSPEKFISAYPELSRQEGVSFIAGDVRSFSFPSGKFDAIILAATSAVTTISDEEQSSVIIDGARHTLEFARACGCRKLLFTSSGAVYGPGTAPFDEIAPCRPVTAYGKSKLAAERILLDSGLDVKIARCFAFTGPHLNKDIHFAIGNFMRDCLAGKDIVINGDGTPMRSYLYADDLVEWLFTILEHGEAGHPYNVGSDEAFSIRALAERVRSALGAKNNIVVKGVPTGAPPSVYVPDISRAKGELGLEVRTGLDDAIRLSAR